MEYTGPPPQELETFLPKDQKKGSSTYKVAPASINVEKGALADYDPFRERKVDHPTSDMDTLTHLLKASLGTGILAMPMAFSYSGLVTGIFATIATALVCTHCAYVLVKCAHTLYYRSRRTTMSFSEVAEVAFQNGPAWAKPWAQFMKHFINYGLFITYFGTCSVYTVIIAENFQQLIEHYFGWKGDPRIFISMLLIPLILLSWVPNLKYLAPFSSVANVFMGVGLLITFYYCTTDMPPISERKLHTSLIQIAPFFGIVIFAMEAIGVVMPLENSMRTPQHFIGICGVLNKGHGETSWCFSQVKGALNDDITDADVISCVEFNHDGDLLATGDKGGRVVIFQRDPNSKAANPRRGEFNVYSTFQSHEPEFDYLKSLEIEEKINKIRWLKRKNQAHFLLSTNDKTIKLWKVSERDKCIEGYNTKEETGRVREPNQVTSLRVPSIKPMDLMVEATPRRVFANAHTYHINSISVNSDQETYLSADDLRINLWNLEITNQSFNIVDIKPSNMEELTEVITAAEFHPRDCNLFVYSSSKGTIRLCDMRSSALCDQHAKLFEEPEDNEMNNKSFFREIISSISDVKMSNSGRYMMSRDYLSIKVWDLHMETKPVETYSVHEYLRTKLCSLYENDCIFDKFECCWNGNDTSIMTGSYNNFFRVFDRNTKKDLTMEASKDIIKPKTVLKPRKVYTGNKRKKDEISVDCLDFNKKILHTAWHPLENILAVAATNNLFIFQDKF